MLLETNYLSEGEYQERMYQKYLREKPWLKKKGIEYIFLVAPNKHTIYFDKLPGFITKVKKRSATDQLVDYLEKNTDITVIDVREQLIKEKRKHDIYYKTGTHWNHYGANVAQYEIMKKINDLFPTKISPELLSNNMFVFRVTRDRGLEGMAGIKLTPQHSPFPIFKNSCTPVKQSISPKPRKTFTTTCGDQKLSAVIFRDSFFIALAPYFARKFKKSTFISGKINYSSLMQHIQPEPPDIIIEEWVERHLPYIPKPIPEFNNLSDINTRDAFSLVD